MSNPSSTTIYRVDRRFDPIIETPKCICQRYGATDWSGILSLLAFYDNGKYFKSLRDEDRFFIAYYLFNDYGTGNKENELEMFKYRPEQEADYFLVEIDGLKKACVAVHSGVNDEAFKRAKHIYDGFSYYLGLDFNAKEKGTFVPETQKIPLYSLNDYLDCFITQEKSIIKELVKDFVRENSIEMMTSDEFHFIMQKQHRISREINKEHNINAIANLANELAMESPLRYAKGENRRTINPDFHNKYHKDLDFYHQFCWYESEFRDITNDFQTLQTNTNDSTALDELKKEHQEKEKAKWQENNSSTRGYRR